MQAEWVDAKCITVADTTAAANFRRETEIEAAGRSDVRLTRCAPSIVRHIKLVGEVPADGKSCRARP